MTRVPDFFAEVNNGKRTCNFEVIGRDLYTKSYIMKNGLLVNHYMQVDTERPDVRPKEKEHLERFTPVERAMINQHYIHHIERCCESYESQYLGPIWSWDRHADGSWAWLYQHIPSGSLYIQFPVEGETHCPLVKQKQEDIKRATQEEKLQNATLLHDIADCPFVLAATTPSDHHDTPQQQQYESDKTIRRSTRHQHIKSMG